jgi:predicted RNA binding protein YcfA (HicA-like mRNA interferase family)
VKRVSGRDLCRVLERKGWTLHHVRGSPHVCVSPDGRKVTVPVHGNKTLATGTQRGLMQDAGLTEADL